MALPARPSPLTSRWRRNHLGCTIQVETFPAVRFADSFFAAFEKHQEPDVLVVENKGVIYGITMRSGEYSEPLSGGATVRRSPAAIEGIASNEAVFRTLEAVPRSPAGLDDARIQICIMMIHCGQATESVSHLWRCSYSCDTVLDM